MHTYVKDLRKNYIWTKIRNQENLYAPHTDDVMSLLVSAPTLACDNFSLPFILEVYASHGGLAAVLS